MNNALFRHNSEGTVFLGPSNKPLAWLDSSSRSLCLFEAEHRCNAMELLAEVSRFMRHRVWLSMEYEELPLYTFTAVEKMRYVIVYLHGDERHISEFKRAAKVARIERSVVK